jgi:cbb3-type cytochrome oxidase maturation protein
MPIDRSGRKQPTHRTECGDGDPRIGECHMMDFLYLIPIALVLGAVGLGAFMWALANGQYDDLDGAAERILIEDEM